MTAPKSRTRRIEPRGLSREEAADYFGVSASHFDNLRKGGTIPEPRELGGRMVWDRLELDAAFDRIPHRGESTNEGNPFDKAMGMAS